MVKLKIDNHDVEVPQGATLLDAANQLGIAIPTLCYLKDRRPQSTCLMCLVKLKSSNRLVPSCATVAMEGMEVESETEEIFQARKAALELLLSEHAGECFAPCHGICPLNLNISRMISQIDEGEMEQAVQTLKSAIAFPGILGRLCAAPCEKGCRRISQDSAVSIRQLERYTADWNLELNDPYYPPRQPYQSKNVAIVGAGPAGLTAAYHLLLEGYGCTLFDDHDKPGGSLLTSVEKGSLPHEILQKEVAAIQHMGLEFVFNTHVGDNLSLDDLLHEYDAVLITVGEQRTEVEWLSPLSDETGIDINKHTYETKLTGVFAAGSFVKPEKLLVHAMAQGKKAAVSISQYLSGQRVIGAQKPYGIRMGRLSQQELSHFQSFANMSDRNQPTQGPACGFKPSEAQDEAHRCFRCGCAQNDNCKLRQYAEAFHAKSGRYKGKKRTFISIQDHPDIVYNPGKCILCGLCIQIASDASEELGLTFTNRGFDVQVEVPFGHSLQEGLPQTAIECALRCPTGALEFKNTSKCQG